MRNHRAIRERDPVQSKLYQKQRAGIPKAPRSSVVTDLQQGTDDVGTKALLENLTPLADELQKEFCRCSLVETSGVDK